MSDFNPANPSISQAGFVFNKAIDDLRTGNLTFERAFSLAKTLPSGTGFVYQFFGSDMFDPFLNIGAILDG